MWITESNRHKHLLYAIPIGFALTMLCVLGVAAGMEYKDRQWGGTFDWLDLAATLAGGAIGQALQLAAIWLAFF